MNNCDMVGYVFIGNSTKPSSDQYNCMDEIILDNVSRPCLTTALDMGFEVFLGVNRKNADLLKCNELPIHCYNSHTYRNIFNFIDNYIAYKNASKLIKKNNIKVIHCNTPVGGMVGRFVGRINHVDKIIYTAHGFHFYKGAPFFQRTIIKVAEKIMARWSDAIITMNREDYEAAKSFKLKKGGSVFLVHGVGIDLKSFKNPGNKDIKRRELGLSEDDIIFVAAGDLIKRKNFVTAIEALAYSSNKRTHYLICGKGPELRHLKKTALKLGVAERVHFLGFRRDIKELLFASDAFLFTSLQEGLPRSVMEAMACGLPCILSNIRGNIDLIDDSNGGYLCAPKDVREFALKIDEMANRPDLRNQMGKNNLEKIKSYDIAIVKKEIENIYAVVLSDYQSV